MCFTDEFGLKIAYYNEKEPDIFFSDLPSNIMKKGFEDFDPLGITSFFTFRYPIVNLTMFKDYKKIPFGHEIKNGEIKEFWYPKFEEKKIDFQVACNRVEELLIRNVKNLIQDKKIAIPLSGGIDSSLMVALCRTICPDDDIYTYSAGFYGDDEFEYARIVANKFNTVHKEKVLRPEDYIGEESLLRPLVKHKGEPLHPNEIALANIEKMAKEDRCEIAICGEGGDDAFGGYGQNLRMYMNYNQDKPFYEFLLDKYRYFTINDRKNLVNEEYLVDDYQLLQSYLVDAEIPENIRNKMFYFIQKFHTPGLITRGANAMRFNNLTPGFPFIDMDLVEYVNSLPFDYKVHWKSEQDEQKAKNTPFREISEKYDITKYILKKISEKYLPEKIIYRTKYGFPVPFDKWFKELKTWPLDNEIFKTNNISNFNGWKKFMIINLNTFIEEFKENKKN